MKDFSAIIAAFCAFAATAALGYIVIPYLRKLKFGQTILDIGPKWHKEKQGTPTMGGIMTIFGVLLALAVTFGFALMCAEIAIGRKTGVSAIEAFGKLNKKFKFVGILCSIVPIIILPYYSVIGGWIIKYCTVFVTGNISSAATDGFFDSFISAPFQPVVWFAIYIGLTALVVLSGVEKGIEKVSKIMMPILVVLTIFIAGYSMFMPGALEGVKFYLMPDFSKFSATTVLAAMGQLFYSMSLAMGIMITYGSYMKKEVNRKSLFA